MSRPLRQMETDQFMCRLSQALNKPIQCRCAELTVLFDRGNIKELNDFFPILIDNIFGPQGTISWGLKTTTQVTNSTDFQALHHFFSPIGPLFKLIYCLLRELQPKYDFSIAYLPMKIRQGLEAGACYPFYADAVYVNPQTKQITSLMLNPFDYFMFHFAYHLINPWHQRTSMTLPSNWSTVYYILCCDYALHFFPTDPRNPILPPVNYYTGKSYINQSPVVQSPPKQVKLLRSSLFKDSLNDYNFVQETEMYPRNDIWRSETLLTVFIDMWLSNDQVVSTKFDFTLTPSKSLRSNELPSGEYIRILRVFVKQLHAFSSSGKLDDTHLGDLKKCSLKMVQGKMYQFLRNLIHQWPLDGSFRLVLELWLSFIQPWRYPGNAFLKHLQLAEANPEPDENTAVPNVDREFLPFIAENLLAYIVIFQQLLPRFNRVDLSSPKNSHMLYRLTKVFDQPNLVPLLKEVEATIINSKDSPSHTFGSPWSSKLPPLSSTTTWSTNTSGNDSAYFNSTFSPQKPYMYGSQFHYSSPIAFESSSKAVGNKCGTLVRNNIFDLEGPNFTYKPLFLEKEPAQEVFELLSQIKKAQIEANVILQTRLDEIQKNSKGITGFFKTIFYIQDHSTDEFSLDDRRKVPTYLEMSYDYILDIFNIRERVENMDLNLGTSGGWKVNCACPTQNNIASLLTPEKVKERIKNIHYEGDPDLHPVRSTESKFLVRVLYMLSKKINEEYQPLMFRLYSQRSVLGSITRQVLQPPIIIYKYDKSILGQSPRCQEELPPRVSLRYFASHKVITYFIFLILLAYLIGHSPLTTLLFVMFVWGLYIFFKAFWHRNDVIEVPQGNLDISHND